MKIQFNTEDVKEALGLFLQQKGLRILDSSIDIICDQYGNFSHIEAELDTTK